MQVVALYDEYVECKQTADDKRAERNASAAKMKGKLEPEERAVRACARAFSCRHQSVRRTEWGALSNAASPCTAGMGVLSASGADERRAGPQVWQGHRAARRRSAGGDVEE